MPSLNTTKFVVKVRLQTTFLKNANPYKSGWHCFRTTLKQERVWGLYKGMSSPLLGVATINALLFGIYGLVLNVTAPHEAEEEPSLSRVAMAGAMSGFFNAFVASPMELIKIKRQAQPNPPSPLTLLRGLSLKTLMRGLTATIYRETPSYGTYFGVYEFLCRSFKTPSGEVPGSVLLVSGGVAGVVAWSVTYPFDVLKTRVQATSDTPNMGVFASLRHIVKTEGAKTLYRGLTATIVRAFPTNAAVFLTYGSMMQILT